jgi:nitroreductase
MDVFQTIKERCSVREYSSKQIERGNLEKIVDAARVAPTARGEEPWEFIVVTEKNILQKLANLAPNGSFLKDAAAAVVVACRDTKYYLEDGCAATENILLAATALGIGSCWVAGDKKPYAAEVLESLGAPQDYKLVSIISLGYPKAETKPHSKKGVKEVIHYNHF